MMNQGGRLMFCKNCGTEIKADAAFCPNCGTAVSKPAAMEVNVQENVPEVKEEIEAVEEVAEVVNEEPVKVENKSDSSSNPFSSGKSSDSNSNPFSSGNNSEAMNQMVNAIGGAAGSAAKKMKSNKKLLGGIIGAAILLVLVLIFALIHKPTINMNKYIEVEFDGYDGVGSIHVTLDWKKIEKDYGDKLKVKKLSKEDKAVLGLLGADQDDLALMYLKECVGYTLDQSTGLSNGDMVTLEWDIETDNIKEYLNVNVKASDKEYKVKDLEKVDLFDPFEYITVEFSGTAPNGYADVKKDNNKEMMNYLNFSISNNSGLSNGDKITITMKMNLSESDFAEKFGCLPSANEKEYEINGLPGYIKSSAEIPEDTMAKMKKQTEDIIMGTTSNWAKESKLVSTEYVGNYFISPKGSSYGYYNRIYLVYKVNATVTKEIKGTASSQDVSYYYGVAFNNLMTVPQDGSVFVDVTQYDKIQNSFRKTLEFIGPNGSVSDSFYFYGYETLDEIYNIAVIKNIENYNYEENITK